MAMLKLTVGQVIELVKQLPQEDKSAVLDALKPETETQLEDKLKQEQEKQLRALSAKRGVEWDNLSQDDRDVIAEVYVP